jgi:hypothetical protein
MKEKKKNRLVKTTALTLLIAATLIISGAVTGINGDINESGENLQATGTGDAIVQEDFSETMHLIGPEEQIEYKTRTKATIVWDNEMDYFALYRGEVGSGVTSKIADDFFFTHTTKVGDVHWISGYWSGSAETPWCIEFFNDNGNEPGSTIDTFCFDWDDIDKVPEGSYWLMNVDIPPVTCDPGDKYWIAIYAEGTSGAPYAGPAMHLHVKPGTSEALWKWEEYGYPDWTPTGAITGYGPADMCFQLTIKPEHDVGVSEILSPGHGSTPGCPCIPVSVEVKNYGSNDETDVPVTVEVHQNFGGQNFGGDYPDDLVFSYGGPGPCTWQEVTMETCYPNAIYPHSGNYFLELNQCGMMGEAWAWTPNGFDLTGDCIDPYLKFYFWHDTYSSDDYLTVDISTGSGWQQVGGPYYRLCCPDCPVGWQEYRISLAAFVGEPFVEVMFRGHCEMPETCYNLGIDSVYVFDMQYQETIEVDIDAGETIEVEFPCWPGECWWCQYENEYVLFWVGAWTDLEGDENPGNDGFGPDQTHFIPTWIYIPWTHDVGDKEILEPSEPYYMAQPLPMKQLIKNYGKEPEGCFNVYMAVRELDKVKKLDETFNCWERDPDHYPTYYYAERPCGWTEVGGYYSDYGWEQSMSNQAGGDSPEAYLYWGYARYYSDNIMRSPAVNTMGEDKLELEFKSFIDHYYGSTYCWMYVEATPDGGMWYDITPWPNPISGNVGPDTYGMDITNMIGPATQVQFRFYGYYFYFDYWFVDDVILTSYTCGDIIWQDKVCIDDIQVCQEIEVSFDDFIPEPPEPCYCGTVDYCIDSWTKMLDPPDQNPANDLQRKFITVEFLHDVALKEFTSPAFDIGGIDWIGYSDGHTENAYKWTDGSPWTTCIELSDPELAPFRTSDLTDVHFSCGCDDYGFYAEDFEIRYATGSLPDIAGVTPIASGTASATGWTTVSVPAQAIPGSGSAFVMVTYTTSVGYPAGFDYDNGDVRGQHMLYIGTTNDWRLLQDFWGSPAVWGIDAGLSAGGGGPELPDPDVYVPCGEQEFCVMVENLGTYDEVPTLAWSFYQYTPNKELIDSGSVDVALAPGAEEEVCMFTYTFDEEGVYEVEVELISATDCNLDNNGPESLIVGADCCGPESCFIIDPEFPDGENNWFVSKVTVTAYAWDACEIQSGVAKIVYIIDGVEDYIPGDHGTFVVDGDGVHFIEIFAVDNVGNEEDDHHTFEIAIDETDPSVELIFDYYEDGGTGMVDFTAIASDATSGIDRVEFYIGSSLEFTDDTFPYEWTIEWQSGYVDETFTAKAFDGAGNSDEADVDGEDISFDPEASSQQQMQQASQHQTSQQQQQVR